MAKRRMDDDVNDLDLIPIMNMVLILIPLLLLSVVFVEISIIEVSMAQKSMGKPADQNDKEPPPRLQVWLSKKGMMLKANENPLPPIQGCSGPETICLSKPDAPKLVDRYNWVEFYNLLFKIKHGQISEAGNGDRWKEVEQFDLIAAQDIPFDVLVKIMDVSRYERLPKGSPDTEKRGSTFTSPEEFDESMMPRPEIPEKGRQPIKLFPAVVLGMPMPAGS